MQPTITWFEIPAVDFDRAVTFYSAIFEAEIHRDVFAGAPHGFLPATSGGVGGAIVERGDLHPNTNGTIIYLNVAEQMTATLGRVERAGGTVVLPETSIDPQGTFAFILDTEGNRIGLHSPPAR